MAYQLTTTGKLILELALSSSDNTQLAHQMLGGGNGFSTLKLIERGEIHKAPHFTVQDLVARGLVEDPDYTDE